MARTAPVWTVRAQLLAKLRPFGQGQAAGKAPPELLPELFRHARGLSPADLRLVLAAYARTESPGSAEGQLTVLQLQDLLVQLLVGGSRLGTAVQLLEAAEAVAAFAPCSSLPAAEFWPNFAERVSRLATSQGLDGGHMARVFAACAQWKRRCHADGAHWGHMLRTVGGRLAEEEKMKDLGLAEVVTLARDAAQLGEPQLRLAAAIGHRVGMPGQRSRMQDLSSQDLIDLIGAAGSLGGRLHMMTRALANELEPRVEELPNRSIVQLCSHLGALKMFPHRLVAALEPLLCERFKRQQFSLEQRLKLLQAFGRLRWRLPEVLTPLLESLDELDGLSVTSLGSILYELYRLDIWDEHVASSVCSRLRRLLLLETGDSDVTANGASANLPHKTAANLLLAMSYFALPEKDLQRRIVQELLRSDEKLPQEALYQVKTFEMALRLGHAAVGLQDLGGLAARWLFSVRAAVGAPEPRAESAFADEVSMVAQNISWHHRPEVEVGPYLLDFAAVSQDEMEEEPDGWDENKPGRSLARFCVAVEADGPSHFYRPHGRPWHWTSTSKLRHRLLTAMRIRVAHVPFYDWLQLEGLAQKEAYLTELLLKAHSTEFVSLTDTAGVSAQRKSQSARSKQGEGSERRKLGYIRRRLLTRSADATP
ncbi:unnamed protein product [Effrenium voratum]|nr:unnamed protein product [Effrenium voratum]